MQFTVVCSAYLCILSHTVCIKCVIYCVCVCVCISMSFSDGNYSMSCVGVWLMRFWSKGCEHRCPGFSPEAQLLIWEGHSHSLYLTPCSSTPRSKDFNQPKVNQKESLLSMSIHPSVMNNEKPLLEKLSQNYKFNYIFFCHDNKKITNWIRKNMELLVYQMNRIRRQSIT